MLLPLSFYLLWIFTDPTYSQQMQGEVTFNIVPDLIQLQPDQTFVSYEIDCTARESLTNVNSITVAHNLTGGMLKTSSDENSTFASGFFENAVVTVNLDVSQSTAFLKARFQDVSASVHFGEFSCAVTGTRDNSDNTTSPVFVSRTAVLRQIGIPAVEPKHRGRDVEVTCKTTAACISVTSVEFYKNGVSTETKINGTQNTTCSYKSWQFNSSFIIKAEEIDTTLQFSCSFKYINSNGTSLKMASRTINVNVGTTYGKPCNSTDKCLAAELCLLDGCGNRTCSCGSAGFYNQKTCERKKRYGEFCSDSDQCSTWLSFCNTAFAKPNCTCRKDEIYNSTTDSCTNIVPCPGANTYTHFPEERKCYKITKMRTNSTRWEDICKESTAGPLQLTPGLRNHMVNRLWNLGFYTVTLYPQVNSANRLQIILSTNYSPGTPRHWYWPDGTTLSLDRDISYPQTWPEAAAVEIYKQACLYMVYNGDQSSYEAALSCNFSASYTGCLIRLPKTYCKENVDAQNNTWNYTEGGTLLNKTCPAGYKGIITRRCGEDGTFRQPYYNCTLAVFDDIQENLKNGTIEPSKALEQIKDVTKNKSEGLYIGDLLSVQAVLEQVVNLTKNETISENATKDFFETANILVDSEKNGNAWQSRVEKEGKGAEELIVVLDNFVKQATESLLKNNQTSLNVTKPNLVLQYAKIEKSSTEKRGIVFPTGLESSEAWKNESTSSLHLDPKAFQGQGVEAYSIVMYKNMSSALPTTIDNRQRETDVEINSQLISVQLLPKAPDALEPNIVFEFNAFKKVSSSNKFCSWWQTDGSGSGRWSTEGCKETFSNDSIVKCSCSHLTNFALLISPYVPPAEHGKILSVITIVGCSISAAALVITIVLHAVYWRNLKSDKTIVNMCLCVTLLVGNLIFISAVSNIAEKAGCTAVAVILHYIFLVVFFLMFAEGVNVFIAIVFVFHKKSHLLQLLAGAFGMPVAIVAISMGATKMEGYGTHGSCWLSRDNGLFWAFAGPAVLIIVLNYIIIVVLFKTMFHTTSFVDKTTVEKAKLTAVALAVMSPVMGVTWIVGIFSIDENTIWLQYVFCIFNSLQGVLIFIFHCVRNKQLHQAMKLQRKRKESLQDFESGISGLPSISGISQRIRKGFAGIMAYKIRSYDIMHMDKTGSESLSTTHHFFNQTEQSELSQSEPERKNLVSDQESCSFPTEKKMKGDNKCLLDDRGEDDDKTKERKHYKNVQTSEKTDANEDTKKQGNEAMSSVTETNSTQAELENHALEANKTDENTTASEKDNGINEDTAGKATQDESKDGSAFSKEQQQTTHAKM